MKLFYVLGVSLILGGVVSAAHLSSDSEDASKESHDTDDSSEEIAPCKPGTIFDDDTQSCVACPTDSIQQGGRCFCPSNLALDEDNNACKACPDEATLVDGECECTSTSLFFSEKDWTCNSCPGTLEPPHGGRGRYECRCTGDNEIFYDDHVICYTCPTGTTADTDNDDCDCPRGTGLDFDYKAGKCVCEHGLTLNEIGVCTRNTPNV